MRIRGRQHWWLIAATMLIGLVYVGKAWTPSSYAITLHVLGISDERPDFGTPRDIRSDEFFVQTPHFQAAVRSGLADVENVSPYKETLRNFMAFPTKDWSVIFKPALWGFLALPPAYAYSLFFYLLAAACFWGWYALLRQLGSPVANALGGALLLTFSQLFQVWWSSNAPTFALAPWVAIAFLAPRREAFRFAAVFFTTAVWLFALLYPPFIYALGVAMAVAVVAFRPDALRWKSILVAGIAATLAAVIVYVYLHDTFEVMRQSVYPGKRSLSGGSVPVSQALNTVLPYINTLGFDPTELAPETRNACETGVVGSYLALLLAFFVVPSSLLEYARLNRRTLAFLGVGLIAMGAWMLLPVPASVGHFILLDMVPPTRLLLGFGLLFHIAIIVIAPSLRYRLSMRRVGALVATIVGVFLVRKGGLDWGTAPDAWFDVVILGILPLAIVAMLWTRMRNQQRGVEAAILVVAAALCNVLTFGTFNPLQSALPIFRSYDDGIVRDLRDLKAWDANGLVALDTWRGAALTGLGIPAVNDTLMSPNLAYFTRQFPDIDPAARNSIFNRYGHVTPRFVPSAKAFGDQITVPIQHYAKNERLVQASLDAVTSEVGAVSSYAIVQLDDGSYDIEVTGWGPFHGVNASQRLLFSGDASPIGVLREPRLDVAAALHDPTLRVAGFRAYFHRNDATSGNLTLAVQDSGQTTLVPGMLSLSIEPSPPRTTTTAEGIPGVIESWIFDPPTRTLTVIGWSHADPRRASGLIVALPGVETGSIQRTERPDLAAAIGEPWRNGGFQLKLTLDELHTPTEEGTCIMVSQPGFGVQALAAPDRPSGCLNARALSSR